tara:strand:- start:1674 stop:1844 length:171 start_codon:yes stop_codon:yes gene_type:complete
MKTVKKVRVSAKLAKRQFNQADSTDKAGVVIVGSFILPMLTFICLNLKDAVITFGF